MKKFLSEIADETVLLQVKDVKARDWYEKEAAEQTWSARTLQRNISSQYYYRMLKTQKQELGKGYAFGARQQYIHTEKQDYYIDLVFYNYILKCFVLIDFKTEKITHQDVGQMDMHIRIYDELKHKRQCFIFNSRKEKSVKQNKLRNLGC